MGIDLTTHHTVEIHVATVSHSAGLQFKVHNHFLLKNIDGKCEQNVLWKREKQSVKPKGGQM